MKNKTKGRPKYRKATAKKLKELVLKVFKRNPKQRLSTKQVARKIKVGNSKDSIRHAINVLIEKGQVIQLKDDRFKYNRSKSTEIHKSSSPLSVYEGKVDMTKRGSAYIICDGQEEDIFVPSRYTKGAMNGDIVKVEVYKDEAWRKRQGKITEIVKRSLSHIVGQIRRFNKYSVVNAFNNEHLPEINVKNADLLNAGNGDMVVVKITSWGKGQNKPLWGKVTKILHDIDENDLVMQSILFSNGFELEFPDTVMKEIENMSADITKEEEALRRDFRHTTTFTIDPLTAKDFDDALSIELLEDGSLRIGIHIADVTHYVKQGSALDKEAYQRSTSVYLVDRVLPMLPEKLSNDLCSLNPEVDRYTFSAVFDFDKDLKITDQWFGKTIIHSDRRFTYEEVQEVLETKEGPFSEELLLLNKVAHRLRKEKFKKGAIAFESEEIRFELDENNKAIGVYVKERKDAHMLVEDFMLLANKSVATYIAKKKPEVPFVYRVHDEPDPDKLADLALMAKELGFSMKIDNARQVAKSFAEMHEKALENEALKQLEPLAIRTMAKAVYDPENIGHYGLAFPYYTHFTSPIRRYSDVLVHRILMMNLEKETRVKKEKLSIMCKHISNQERNAMKAERESVKYKQVEYIADRIGQEFDGRISGMIERGIFVELGESKAEGLIGFDKLNDVFVLHHSKLKAFGKRRGSTLKIGQKVRAKVLSADLSNRQIEMDILKIEEL